jgi:filamentous hemagglutinin
MAVQGTVTGGVKGKSQGSVCLSSAAGRSWIDRLVMRAVAFFALCMLGVLPVAVDAQVVAASANDKPVVGVTANGIPLVEISTPNGAGISNNNFTQYDVGSEGLILNNATSTVQTQQAGLVVANPHLAGSGARIIVNEVVSGSPSQLLGYTEVAGQRADVIIANAAGVFCNGCGFINTNRGVLTTGAPVFGGTGSLDAFHVTGGQIQIGPDGLNASDIAQVDLIARSVAINGQVCADKSLHVVAGHNDIRHDDLNASALGPDGNSPVVAIDVSQLGGIYAGKIMLVSTETGAGVNSAGPIAAQSGELMLSSEGKVTLSGRTSATANLTVHGARDVEHTGSLYAGQDTSLSSQGAISNRGVVAAKGSTSVTGAMVDSTGTLAAGVDTNGKLARADDLRVAALDATGLNAAGPNVARLNVTALNVTASGALNAMGQNKTSGNLAFSGSRIAMNGAQTLARGSASLTTTGRSGDTGDLALTGGTFQTNEVLMVQATGAVSTDQAQVGAGRVALSAASLSNHDGTLSQTGHGPTTLNTSGALDNTGGTISTMGRTLTLKSGNFTNANGTLTQAGTDALTLSTGTLNNSGGTIASNGRATITASRVDNRRGAITSSRALVVKVSGNLDNTSGKLQSSHRVQLSAASVNNTAGRLVSIGSSPVSVSASGQITNAGGTTAHGEMGGLIGSNDDTTVRANSIANSSMITAQHLLNVVASDGLDNSNGKLSGDRTTMSAAAITNANGSIGGNVLQVSAPQLDNRRGQIVANALSLSGANLTNQQGAISQLGSGPTTLSVTNTLDNSNGGTIETASTDLTLTPASLNNDGGTITHTGSGMLMIDPSNGSGRITNVGGQISSNGHAVIRADSVNNANGVLGANDNLSITAAALLGRGTYRAVNDLTLNLQGDFSVTPDDHFNAGNTLAFTLSGTLNNVSALSAVNDLTVNAGDIRNVGSMAAGGLLGTQSSTLINTGTLVGGSVSLQARQTIANLGTSALIGATDSNGRLELLAPDIENRDDTTATDTQASTTIYGLGQVVLAGAKRTNDKDTSKDSNKDTNKDTNDKGTDGSHANGKGENGNYTRANVIHNQSGLIQSGRDLAVHATRATNTRRAMAVSGLTSSVDAALLQRLGINLSGRTGQVGVPDPNSIGGVYVEPPHGGQYHSSYRYTTYTGTAQASTVTSISPRAQLISGGNLDLSDVGIFQNGWSQVAATGNITPPQLLDQDSWRGQTPPQVQVSYTGDYHYRNYDGSVPDWTYSFCGNGASSGCDAPADVRTYALPSYESTFAANGSISGTGVTLNNTAGNVSVPPLGTSLAVPVVASLADRVTLPGGLDASNPVIAGAVAINVLGHITLPAGGLFSVDRAPRARYLIETNPAFTNLQQWLSSDYYFRLMGMDPGLIQLRLGDGFYEQRLVQAQILSLTGKSALTNDASAQDTFKALMTSGVKLAKSLQLAPGIGLSAEQVAQLTSDVVIMQTQIVDGQSVLVPVVYLAKSSQENMGNGPVIAATNIDLENATVVNSGAIQASNALSIAGDRIDSTHGALQSGGQMSLVTKGDVNLTSATVRAGDLNLNAGGDLILDTAVKRTNQTGPNGQKRIRTTLGPRATIDVLRDASIQTGGDFEQNAGELNVGGALSARVGGNWTPGVRETGETKVVNRANGVSATHFVNDTGSSVKVGGASQITVDKDLSATGAHLNLQGGGSITAGGNVSLQAATATSTIDSHSSGSDRHGSYAETLHRSDDTVAGTTLKSGNSLSIMSGKDINVTGSRIDLTQGKASLAAAGDINVGAATETHTLNTDETHRHATLGGRTSAANRSEHRATYANGGTISADSVSVSSGKNLTVTGSTVVGTHDIDLNAANNIGILAATNTYQDSEYHREKHSGLSTTGGLGIGIGSSEQSDRYNANSTIQSQSRSTVGSVEGNVSMTAGQDVHIGGSDVIAGKAAIDVSDVSGTRDVGATGNIGMTGNVRITSQNVVIDPSQDNVQSHDQQAAHSSGLTTALTGTPLDAVRNARDDVSTGSTLHRTQSVLTGIGASALDVPSTSVSYGRSGRSSTTDQSSLIQTGSTIRGGGDVSITAMGVKDAQGRSIDGDLTVTGATIGAGRTTSLSAHHDVTLQASSDTLEHSSQSGRSRSSFSLASPGWGDWVRWIGGTANNGGVSPSPYNTTRSGLNGTQSATTQAATVVTGNRVIVRSQTGDISVIGSGISGAQGVDLVARQGAINVLAGVDSRTDHEESSRHQIGSLGSNGTSTGFSVGVLNSHDVRDTGSHTQSTVRSQIVSGNGTVTLDAKQDVTVVGSDLGAGQDLTLIGKNLHLDPGTDATQSQARQRGSQFGLTVALGGAVGNAVATVNQRMDRAVQTDDSRLAALDTAQAGLAAYNAYQAADRFANVTGATGTTGTAGAAGSAAQPLIKATVSIGGGSSRSESQNSRFANMGGTLSAGGDVKLIATGSETKETKQQATNKATHQAADGDIHAQGTQIIGRNVTLNAAHDIDLESAKDRSQQSSSNRSNGGSIGIGTGLGGQQNGFTLELGAGTSRGNARGHSVTNRDTGVTASNTVSITSGRDTKLRGAEVSGKTVEASVGRDLTVQSQQDTSSYDSKQSDAGLQASLCVPPFCIGQTVSGSGSVSVSQQRIDSTYQSVKRQSGIFAGEGGFDVDVQNHTQLDGGLIASTAAPDKNSLSTQTFAYTDLKNHANDSGNTIGLSASGGVGQSTSGGVNLNTPVKQVGRSAPGPSNSQGLGPSGFSVAGTGDSASGTTHAAISPGTITVRGDTGTTQDSTTDLSRDTASVNGSVWNTFDAQKMQDDLAIQQGVGQVGMLVVGNVASALENQASAAQAKAALAYENAKVTGDSAGMAQAQTDYDSARQQVMLWGNDGPARIASHATVAGLGAVLGGGNVAGAVGGTVAGDVASNRASAAVIDNDTLGGTLISNVASGFAGAVAGGALGGTSGATSGAGGALNADLYNRQLHSDEKAAIREKASGDAAEERRLTAAACYVVRCWAEFSPNSPKWLANYMSPEEAKGLGPELQWVSGQKARSGLFVYTLPQQARDLGLSQFDQFRRGVTQFGQNVKNLPRDIANTRIGMPGDVQQGDASPQADITGGGNDRTPPTATAVVTPSVMPCRPGVLCPTVSVSPVVTSGAPMLSSGSGESEDSGNQASNPKLSSSLQQAASNIKLVEQDGNIYQFSIPGAIGDLSVVTEMTQKGNQLVLNGTHIDGPGAGSSSLRQLREVARALGQQYGADEVVINGGTRTSGANPGKVPRSITIKVNQ